MSKLRASGAGGGWRERVPQVKMAASSESEGLLLLSQQPSHIVC